ncbi:MAG: hypothetical protein AAFN77_15150 [Planctomycetota bacterium]
MGFVRETPAGRVYEHNGFQCTVDRNGAIRARPGDWVSKYSQAIFGDYVNMESRFGKRHGGIIRSYRSLGASANINLLNPGEVVYVMKLPDEMGGIDQKYGASGGGEATRGSEITVRQGEASIPRKEWQKRIQEVLDYIANVLWIGSGWTLEGTDSIALGGNTPGFKIGGSLAGLRYALENKAKGLTGTMYGATLGGSVGVDPEPCPVSFTFGLPSFIGCIFKSPTAGGSLSKSELTGAVLTIEVGGHLVGGGSLIFILGGPGLIEYFTNPILSIARVVVAKWMIICLGSSISTGADISATASLGYVSTV